MTNEMYLHTASSRIDTAVMLLLHTNTSREEIAEALSKLSKEMFERGGVSGKVERPKEAEG